LNFLYLFSSIYSDLVGQAYFLCPHAEVLFPIQSHCDDYYQQVSDSKLGRNEHPGYWCDSFKPKIVERFSERCCTSCRYPDASEGRCKCAAIWFSELESYAYKYENTVTKETDADEKKTQEAT
jgi:hypothetical protein